MDEEQFQEHTEKWIRLALASLFSPRNFANLLSVFLAIVTLFVSLYLAWEQSGVTDIQLQKAEDQLSTIKKLDSSSRVQLSLLDGIRMSTSGQLLALDRSIGLLDIQKGLFADIIRRNRISNRPKLVVTNKDVSHSINVISTTDTSEVMPILQDTGGEIKLDTAVALMRQRVDVRTTILLQNNGINTADIVGIISYDSLSRMPFLRDDIFKERGFYQSHGFMEEEDSFEYPSIQIVSGDTLSRSVNVTFETEPPFQTVIHILIFYEDEHGSLYDSYFMFPVGYDSATMNFVVAQKDSLIAFPAVFAVPLKNFRKNGRTNITYYDYSEQQKLEVMKLVKTFM